MSDNKLKERRQELAGLIDTVSRFALPLFYQLFAHSDSRLILTDQHGVIVGSWGKLDFVKTEPNRVKLRRMLARADQRNQRYWHGFD